MATSKYKLVYSTWVNCAQGRLPVANGNHLTVTQWINSAINETTNPFSIYDRFSELESTFQVQGSGIVYRHSNLYYYFKKHYGVENIIHHEQIVDDDSLYFYPYEVEGQNINYFYSGFKFNQDGQEIEYNFIDSLPPSVLDHLRSGKLKILIASTTEPTYGKDTLAYIEKGLSSIGIDPANIYVAFGNTLTNYAGKLKQITAHASLQQQAEIANKYPIERSSLGYPCDYPRVHELDNTKIRPKRFLCWNRTMNRPHRLAIAYIALKYKLLSDSTFSFIHGVSRHHIDDLRSLIDDSYNEILIRATSIIEMIPYEVDTQDLTLDGKQGFQTNENNKKEFYADSYLHITSETCFDTYGSPFMSEKTFRPILNLQPFIYIGNYKGLEELRRLGFKTFDGYIDESYDLEPDPKKRFAMITAEILRFANMSIEELHQWYYSVVDILIYNQQHFLTFKDFNPLQGIFEGHDHGV